MSSPKSFTFSTVLEIATVTTIEVTRRRSAAMADVRRLIIRAAFSRRPGTRKIERREVRSVRPTRAVVIMKRIASALVALFRSSRALWSLAVRPRSRRVMCRGPAVSSLSRVEDMLYPFWSCQSICCDHTGKGSR